MTERESVRWTVRPIGVVHSPFSGERRPPPQPALAGEEAVGTVEVFPEYEEGLDQVEMLPRIWIVSWLDRAGPVRMRLVPRGRTGMRGLFTTRAPSRPNPIGISPVRLLRRDGLVLHVSGLDLMDGTPVLDIKPYMPQIDAFADEPEV